MSDNEKDSNQEKPPSTEKGESILERLRKQKEKLKAQQAADAKSKPSAAPPKSPAKAPPVPPEKPKGAVKPAAPEGPSTAKIPTKELAKVPEKEPAKDLKVGKKEKPSEKPKKEKKGKKKDKKKKVKKKGKKKGKKKTTQDKLAKKERKIKEKQARRDARKEALKKEKEKQKKAPKVKAPKIKRVKKKKLDKGGLPERKRYLDAYSDPRKQFGRAIMGGFVAVLAVFFVTYVLGMFSDNLLGDYIHIFGIYSGGSGSNEVVGYWALAYTPISSLNIIEPTWMDDWFTYLGPVMIGGVIIALATRSFKYCLVGGFWFIVWAMLLPALFIVVFPFFGGNALIQEQITPMGLNGAMISIFHDILTGDDFVVFFKFLTNSPYLGWCMAGALQLGAVALLFSLPFGAIFSLLRTIVRGRI